MTLAPDNSALQVFYGTLPLIGTAVLAIWNNNKRLDDLKTALNKRIDDLAAEMRSNFTDVKTSLGKLDTRVSDLEKNLHLVRP
jgi:hypothetical protein